MSPNPETEADTGRFVIIVNQDLPIGRSANAAAVIALTMGKLRPDLAGPDLVDQNNFAHPGLIPIGISILGATADELKTAREKALSRQLTVVDFPTQGQQTNDYDEFRRAVSSVATSDLSYVGVGIYGPRKLVGKVAGKFGFVK